MNLSEAYNIVDRFFKDREINFFTHREASYFLWVCLLVPYSIFLTDDNGLVLCFQNTAQTSFVEIEFNTNIKQMRIYDGLSLLTDIKDIQTHTLLNALQKFK